MYIGITAAALEQALQYARDRSAFGRPIGAFQAVQHPLAETATIGTSIGLAVYRSRGSDTTNRAPLPQPSSTRMARDP